MLFDDPAVIAQIAGFGVFLWVGLYLLVRAPARRPLIAASLAGLLAEEIFFTSCALADTTADLGLLVALQRGFWWTTVLPAAAWFHVSSLIARGPGRRPLRLLFTRRVVAIYTLALCIVLLGSFTDLFDDYPGIARTPRGYALGPGPAYPAYIAYLALAAAGALVNLARAFQRFARRPDAAGQAMALQLRLLAAGALSFLIGALWISVRKYLGLPVSAVPGFLCLFIGLAALGYGIAHFG